MRHGIIRITVTMLAAFSSSTAASFLSAFPIGLVLSAQDSAHGPYDMNFALLFASLATWGSSIISATAILILPVPLHLLAFKLERVSRKDYTIVGAFVGMGVCLTAPIPGQMAAAALVIAPLMGAAAALALWIVTRPDKAAPDQED